MNAPKYTNYPFSGNSYYATPSLFQPKYSPFTKPKPSNKKSHLYAPHRSYPTTTASTPFHPDQSHSSAISIHYPSIGYNTPTLSTNTNTAATPNTTLYDKPTANIPTIIKSLPTTKPLLVSASPQPNSFQTTYIPSEQRPFKQCANTEPFPIPPLPLKKQNKQKMSTGSRRLLQRREKGYAKKRDSQCLLESQTKIRLTHTFRKCRGQYGICTDPTLTLHQNFKKAISTLPPKEFIQPQNLKIQNLCTQNQLHPGTKELLGLNLKFRLAPRTIKNNINNTILRMARSIRTRYYLVKYNLLGDSKYEKQIYKRNLNWHPPPGPLIIEEKLTEFEKSLKFSQQKIIKKH
jgi:hypothetical protein